MLDEQAMDDLLPQRNHDKKRVTVVVTKDWIDSSKLLHTKSWARNLG